MWEKNHVIFTTHDWERFESHLFVVMTGGWFIIVLTTLVTIQNYTRGKLSHRDFLAVCMQDFANPPVC